MDQNFHVFDMHRIFLGNAPALFLLEIIFRTLVMYAYTVFLLRLLGKRGMGQLSMLELAIIISFGSAVGDPMVGADVPILHGMLAITVVTAFQICLERLINKNKKVEAIMEGEPNLIVNDGVIQWTCMKKDNISKEDLFRSLRAQDVDHLGQIKKAFFETSGNVSVMFQPPKKIMPGLSILPENAITEGSIQSAGERSRESGHYSCMECGTTINIESNEVFSSCPVCSNKRWIGAEQI
jgi:uncharacterized membrane protein YcaP (DUF421 family)